jgi:hypothetical protein
VNPENSQPGSSHISTNVEKNWGGGTLYDGRALSKAHEALRT